MTFRLRAICKLSIISILPWQLVGCQGSSFSAAENEPEPPEITLIDSVVLQELDEAPFLRRPSMFEVLNDSLLCMVANSATPTIYNYTNGATIAQMDTSQFLTSAFYNSRVQLVQPNIDTCEYRYLSYDAAMHHIAMAGIPNFQTYTDFWVNKAKRELAFSCLITTPHFVSSLSDTGTYVLMQQHLFIAKTDFQLQVKETINVTEVVNSMLSENNQPYIFPAFGFALVNDKLFSGMNCVKSRVALDDKFLGQFSFTASGVLLDSLITATDFDPAIYFNSSKDWDRYYTQFNDDFYCSNVNTIINVSQGQPVFEAFSSQEGDYIYNFQLNATDKIHYTLLDRPEKGEEQTFHVYQFDGNSKEQKHLITFEARNEMPAIFGDKLVVLRTGGMHNYFDIYAL